MIEKPSPNFNERKGVTAPYLLILHYTGTRTAEEADAIYMTTDHVSPHYMIDRDGTITKYVDEKNRAWHAGASSWNGFTDINSASIGIEIVNGGHENEFEDFPDIQIDKLIALIKEIRLRWPIPDCNILGHSDVAPGRKIDPGEKFPWSKLQEAGVGLMPQPGYPVSQIDTPVELFAALKEWGYDYTEDLDVLVTEFRRHYLPESFGTKIEDEIVYSAITSLLDQKKLTSP